MATVLAQATGSESLSVLDIDIESSPKFVRVEAPVDCLFLLAKVKPSESESRLLL